MHTFIAQPVSGFALDRGPTNQKNARPIVQRAWRAHECRVIMIQNVTFNDPLFVVMLNVL